MDVKVGGAGPSRPEKTKSVKVPAWKPRLNVPETLAVPSSRVVSQTLYRTPLGVLG